MAAGDCLGNELSSVSAEALAGINDFITGFLGYQTRAVNVLPAADSAPDALMAQIYAGMLMMFSDTTDAPALARPHIARAYALAGNGTERERMNLALLEAWADGDMPKALAIGEQIVTEYPRDLAALKLHQTFNFNRGNAPDMLRLARLAEPHNGDNAHLLAMLAFGYEQCHLLAKAESTARRALEIDRTQPWAHHALAHVMLTEGRVTEGIDFMQAASETWTNLNSFMLTHNWWHLALFHISTGETDRVLALYDDHCWGVEKSYSQDQIGAVSLLARMELAGMTVDTRWDDLGAYLKARAEDTLQPFMTMQYLYGLAKAGLPEADRLMQAVTDRAAGAAPFERVVWQEVALPACRGLLAHARGDYAMAVVQLGLAMPRMMEVGGSHAQRDLFAQVLLDAHIKSGNAVTAQQMLESRRRYDPNGVPLNRMLARVYEKLGLMDEAHEAAARHY